MTRPFSLLQRVFGDPEMAVIFSETATVEGWLKTEAALAKAQGAMGIIPESSAAAIAAACSVDRIDLESLWDQTTNVGYPILPLVRLITGSLPDGPDGHVHFGATTQDIMDSGLALQLAAASDRLTSLLTDLGDRLADVTAEHATTPMAGRTHAQQALPITFGGKMAVFLEQCSRALDDLDRVRSRVAVISLHGAAGSSASFGDRASELRARVAESLDLAVPTGPWHVARDGVADYGAVCARISAITVRLAREVVDLSRSEVGEVSERNGHHRGASSTMPQKVNPIDSETATGFAVTATSLSGTLYRAMEAGHERSSGEWQIEWEVLPQVSLATAGAVAAMVRAISGLTVKEDRMAENLMLEDGRILAEAYMMRLAPILGREKAHDVVYTAATRSREEGKPLHEMLVAEAHGVHVAPLEVSDYLGESAEAARAAVAVWATRSERRTSNRSDERAKR